MLHVELSRSDKTKRWNIPDKFINCDFVRFLNNTFPISEAHQERDFRTLRGYGSVKEYADYFQLQENHGITLEAILKLLNDKGCFLKLNKKENFLKYHNQNIQHLRVEIEARIKK